MNLLQVLLPLPFLVLRLPLPFQRPIQQFGSGNLLAVHPGKCESEIGNRNSLRDSVIFIHIAMGVRELVSFNYLVEGAQ